MTLEAVEEEEGLVSADSPNLLPPIYKRVSVAVVDDAGATVVVAVIASATAPNDLYASRNAVMTA